MNKQCIECGHNDALDNDVYCEPCLLVLEETNANENPEWYDDNE